MDCAIHARRGLTGGMATIIRTVWFAPSVVRTADAVQVLDGFHAHKKERGVDELLVKLYEPILWRALKVCQREIYRMFESCGRCRTEPCAPMRQHC